MDQLTWAMLIDWLNKAALVAIVIMFAAGYLVSRPTLEKHILAPRDARIDALERAMARKDEEHRELYRQQASTVATQTTVISTLLSQLSDRTHDRRD